MGRVDAQVVEDVDNAMVPFEEQVGAVDHKLDDVEFTEIETEGLYGRVEDQVDEYAFF